jgi:hypothetical protein
MPVKQPSTSVDLLAKMKAIEARALQRSQQRREQAALPLQTAESPPPAAKVVKLPLWPEAVRAVPNGFLRSALFGAIRRGPRRYLDRERIGALEGIEIFYTGQRLDQGDLDVWEVVLHAVRFQGLGDKCQVTAYQLLKALGKTDSGKNRDILDRRLSRLNATAVRVKQGRYSYEGSLIDEAYQDEKTRAYMLNVNSKLRSLYEPDQFTQIDWVVRRELDGQPLAQWLHGFYASHAQPYPISIAKLHELSGSEAGECWKFAQTLRKNLDSLVKASTIHGQPFSYFIQNDVVYADKMPSRSQQRYLTKKIRKSKSHKI